MSENESTTGGGKLDPDTAESAEQDPDFAAEHQSPTFADEPSTEAPDESVPSGYSGMDPGTGTIADQEGGGRVGR